MFLGAAFNVGLTVVPDGEADAYVCGPDGLEEYADRAAATPVVACALAPLGVRFRDPLPSDVHDFGVEVWSQPDAFRPWDPPGAEDEALPGTGQAALLTPSYDALPLADGDRLITTANPVTPEGLATFVQPLVRGGSTVWVRNADPAAWERRREAERATAESGQPARS